MNNCIYYLGPVLPRNYATLVTRCLYFDGATIFCNGTNCPYYESKERIIDPYWKDIIEETNRRLNER